MNPRIFVGAAAAAMAAIIVSILVAGPAIVADIPGQQATDGDMNTAQILPLQISLDEIEVKKISERSATIEVSFILHNPNARSVIVQTLDYQLFERGEYDETGAIAGGQIGSRPQGLVEFGSNYYTLLAGNSITLRDTSTISNPGDPEFWDTLKDGTAIWHVSGDVFYNLSSMTSGQENELHFEFTR